MVAVLQPIEACAIAAPVYDNDNLSIRDWWVVDNAKALLDYWRLLEGAADEDFTRFAWCQWDREMARRDAYRNTLRQY